MAAGQAAGSIAGSYLQSRSARKAARAQAEAMKYVADLQQKRYEQTREDFAPFRQVGTQAINSLANLSGLNGSADFSSFERSPGYQFRLQQGEQALNRSAAARGRLDSGATMQDLMNYGQGMASQEFGAHYNRLAGLAGAGQTSTNQLAGFGAQAAAAQGNAMAGMGQARASGYINQGNALSSGIGDLAEIYGTWQSGGYNNQNQMQRVNGGWEWSNT